MTLFDQLQFFSNPPSAVVEQEIGLYAPSGLTEAQAQTWFGQRLSMDVHRFDDWANSTSMKAATFTQLDVTERRAYLDLWCRSALGIRRRVYKTVRALTYATAFSTDALWKAIGYEGPLLPRTAPS